ncbi:MAG: HAD family hydrolase [bacterium]|nr:HAD family hydrolase [bacterium]
MKSIDTVIFDLDGTLLYTLEDLRDSVNYALEQMHYPKRSLSEVQKFVGNGIYRLIERAVPEKTALQQVNQTFEHFKAHYIVNCNNKTKPYDDIMVLLAELKMRGYKLAIVSNKNQAAVEKLSAIYFKGLIEVSIGATETIHKKPAPDTVYKAIEALNSSTEHAIYIGDSEVDIQTAVNANIPYVSVSWGFRTTEFLKEQGASTIIDTPLELLTILEEVKTGV